MSFLDTKKPLILLHKDLASMPDIAQYDIMLSPQFYITRREELPVKYPFQAKKLASSILDDIAGDDDLTYEAFRDGDKWVLVGYDLQKIVDFLDFRGGSIDKVGHIYFAEQAKNRFSTPVEINQKEALGIVNGTVTVVPKQLLSAVENYAGFDGSFRPEKSFHIQRGYGSFIDNKQAIIFAGLMIILAMLYFAEGFRYQQAVSESKAKLDELLSANPSLKSTYKRESLYKKYITINKEQRAIRDRINDISGMTSNKTKIDLIMIDKQGYKVTLDIPSGPKIVNSLRTIALDKGFKNLKIKGNKLESQGSFQ